MRKNIAVAVLALVFTMNAGSGYTQSIDHRMFKIESSLCERLDDRLCTERIIEAERKARSRHRLSCKA